MPKSITNDVNLPRIHTLPVDWALIGINGSLLASSPNNACQYPGTICQIFHLYNYPSTVDFIDKLLHRSHIAHFHLQHFAMTISTLAGRGRSWSAMPQFMCHSISTLADQPLYSVANNQHTKSAITSHVNALSQKVNSDSYFLNNTWLYYHSHPNV